MTMKMQMRTAVAATGAAAVIMVAPGLHAGSPRDRATGGGQILVGTRGAGDTIAFTAQGTPQQAREQVQFVDRTGGIGKGNASSTASSTAPS